jgi:hypothetical protein
MDTIRKRRALIFVAVSLGATVTFAALALLAYYRPVL